MTAGRCASSPGHRVQLAVRHDALEVVARAGRVGQPSPFARPGIERIQPGDVPARMAKLMSRHQIDQSIVDDGSGATSETIGWNGRPFLPAIGRRIVEVDVRQWRLASSRAGESAENVDLSVED